MGRRKKIFPNVRDIAIQNYIIAHPEKSLKEIGRRFRMSKQAVSQRIKGLKIPWQRKPVKISISGEVVEEYILKYPKKTQKEVADYFGVSIPWIANRIKEMQIPYQSKSYLGGTRIVRISDLIEYIRKHPNAIQSEIALHFRVRQSAISRIINKEKIPYKRKNPR